MIMMGGVYLDPVEDMEITAKEKGDDCCGGWSSGRCVAVKVGGKELHNVSCIRIGDIASGDTIHVNIDYYTGESEFYPKGSILTEEYLVKIENLKINLVGRIRGDGCSSPKERAKAKEAWVAMLNEGADCSVPLWVCATCGHEWDDDNRPHCVACGTPYRKPNERLG